jgi:transaldolase
MSPSSTSPNLDSLRVKVFADGADLQGMLAMARLPYVRGFTTNPTLMRKAGVQDYRAFAQEVVAALPGRPLSFEVFSDEWDEMERQARVIAAWGSNVYVKVPVSNTRGEPAYELVRRLSADGLQLNVTALMTLEQVRATAAALTPGTRAFVSLFAGRIADSGRDPVPMVAEAVDVLRPHAEWELIWASPREVLNVVQADAVGCHVITMTPDLIRKLPSLGKELTQFSLETVRMFHEDGRAAGFSL